MIQRLLDYLKNIFISKEEFQRLCKEQDQWVEEMNAKQFNDWLQEQKKNSTRTTKTDFTNDDVPF